MAEKNKSLVDELTEIFQNLPSRLEPDAKNEFQHYSYNSIQQIKEVVGKELKKHGILFIPTIEGVETKEVGEIQEEETKGNKTVRNITKKIQATVHFLFKFQKDGQAETISSYGQATDSQGKSLSKAKSDAIKRLFTDTFLIATSDEDDEKDYGKNEKFKAPESTKKPEYHYKNPDAPATARQKEAIYALEQRIAGNKKEEALAALKGDWGIESLDELTVQKAGTIIDDLQQRAKRLGK